MSIEKDLNRIANALEKLAGISEPPLVSAGTPVVPVAAESEAPAPARKPGRPAKDAGTPAIPATPATPASAATTQVACSGPVTLDMLKEALRKVVKKEGAGPAAAKAILTQFGVQAVTAIEPARYAELHKAFLDAAA